MIPDRCCSMTPSVRLSRPYQANLIILWLDYSLDFRLPITVNQRRQIMHYNTPHRRRLDLSLTGIPLSIRLLRSRRDNSRRSSAGNIDSKTRALHSPNILLRRCSLVLPRRCGPRLRQPTLLMIAVDLVTSASTPGHPSRLLGVH